MSDELLVAERELLSAPLSGAGVRLEHAYIVGGAVRDALLGRPTLDLDVIVKDDPGRTARAIARALGAPVFPLSERHGAWRVASSTGGTPTVDVSPLHGGGVKQDLGRRDFTVNALAVRLSDGALIDAVDGRSALLNRSLIAVSDATFSDDPLRLLRLARFASELGFAVAPKTIELATAAALLVSRSAGERVVVELAHLLAADARVGLALLDRTGVGAALLPTAPIPLTAAASAIERIGADRVQSALPEVLQPELDRQLDETTDVRAALRLAALFAGGRAPAEAAGALRLSRAAATLVVRAAQAADRPPPLDPPALLRWLQDARPAGLAAISLAIARDPAMADRGALACELARPRRRLVTGDDLRDLLGLTPGPSLGAVLGQIADAQALRQIETREQALELARRLLR